LEHLPAYEPLKDLWPHGSSRLINLFVKKSFENEKLHCSQFLPPAGGAGAWRLNWIWRMGYEKKDHQSAIFLSKESGTPKIMATWPTWVFGEQ